LGECAGPDTVPRAENLSRLARDHSEVVFAGHAECRHQQWHDARLGFLTKEEGMNDDRTKADKAWEARQEAARYRIFNAATNAAEATDEADDQSYFAVLDQAGNAAEAAAAEITGYETYADLLEALDTRRKQS
jgi:hypothetical protein